MNLDVESSANFRLGILLATVDGGKTWNWAPASPGRAGAIRFITAQDGWMAGGPGNGKLYATHDGSHSWRRVSLKAPRQVSVDREPVYDLPTFRDKKNGLLPVTFAAPESLALVLFATSDGGRSWKTDRIVTKLPAIYSGVPFPSALTDSTLKTAYSHEQSGLIVTTGRPDGSISRTITATAIAVTQVHRIDFAGPTRGWLLADHALLSSGDGGSSWEEITLPQLRPASPVSPPVKMPSAMQRHLEFKRTPAGASAPGVSIHLGFHACNAPDYANTMSAWWSKSPFYDVGIYIGGSNRSCANKQPIVLDNPLANVALAAARIAMKGHDRGMMSARN